MNEKVARVAVILLLVAAVVVFYAYDLGRYLSFSGLKEQREILQMYYHEQTVQALAIYFVIYVMITGMSLPGAAIMTLAGGAIFGLLAGTVVVSFASTIGATIAFFVSRFIAKDYVQQKFGEKLKTINTGIENEGSYYLFTLRLIPAFPFFVINMVMGLTPIKTRTFFLVSQLGMLPGTIVYVNAGTELGKLESAAGVLSPSLIISFAILGLFPLIVKKVMGYFGKTPIRASSDDNAQEV